MEKSLELTIHRLLSASANDDAVFDHLESVVNLDTISAADFKSLARFYQLKNQSPRWIRWMIGNYFRKNLPPSELQNIFSRFSWPHFVEALFESCPVESDVSDDLKSSILKGATDLNQLDELALNKRLDSFDSSFADLRKTRRSDFKFKHLVLRDDLNQQLELMRTQGLKNEELNLLERCLKLFPGEMEYHRRITECRELMALELLSRKPSLKRRSRPIERKDPSEAMALIVIEEAQIEEVRKDIELAKDFALSHIFWDHPEVGLQFIELMEDTPARDWLKVELLNRAKYHIELLQELSRLEKKYSNDPEATWAIIYFQALSFWGIGEKQKALNMMESLCSLQPDYRSATAILSEMREDLE